MIQKHINIKNLQGTVSLNKDILVDLAELVRISPISSRLLFFIMGYADDNNEIITNVKTLSKYLGKNNIPTTKNKNVLQLVIQLSLRNCV